MHESEKKCRHPWVTRYESNDSFQTEAGDNTAEEADQYHDKHGEVLLAVHQGEL